MIHTKIICTIGPAVNSLENILALMNAGMNDYFIVSDNPGYTLKWLDERGEQAGVYNTDFLNFNQVSLASAGGDEILSEFAANIGDVYIHQIRQAVIRFIKQMFI